MKIDKVNFLNKIKDLISEVNDQLVFKENMIFLDEGIDSLDYAFIVANLERNYNVDILNRSVSWQNVRTPIDLFHIFENFENEIKNSIR